VGGGGCGPGRLLWRRRRVVARSIRLCAMRADEDLPREQRHGGCRHNECRCPSQPAAHSIAAPSMYTFRLVHPPMADSTFSGQGAGGAGGAGGARGAGGGSSAPAPERERGASPLHDLLEDSPEFFAAEVLARLGPAACAVVAQVGHPWLAAVVSSGLPRAGKSVGVPLKLKQFIGSVRRLAWAKANGCPWNMKTTAFAARGGNLEVLRWARENGCMWRDTTCSEAAYGGHLEVLIR